MRYIKFIAIIVLLNSNEKMFTQTVGSMINKACFKKENGCFKGKISSFKPYDNNLKTYILSFAYWSIVGEPAQDFKFYWESSGNFKVSYEVGSSNNTVLYRTELEKYSDLLKRFDAIVPSKVTFNLGILFCDSTEKSYFLGGGISVFDIDLPGVSGDHNQFSVPGSPNWKDFLKYPEVSMEMDKVKGFKDSSETKKNKILFSKANTIVIKTEFSEPVAGYDHAHVMLLNKATIFDELKIVWPQNEIDAIYKEYMKRENGETPTITKEIEQKTKVPEKTYTKDDFWSETDEDEKPNEIINNKNERVHRYTDKGYYGLKDEKGNVVVDALYSFIEGSENIFRVVNSDFKEGIINSKGIIMLDFIYDHIELWGDGTILAEKFDESLTSRQSSYYTLTLRTGFVYANNLKTILKSKKYFYNSGTDDGYYKDEYIKDMKNLKQKAIEKGYEPIKNIEDVF